mmetsp:Transcript_30960/g.70873  ORF Transcript_30960/g.70873 Transcript_30960/m.70873 type:complete len:138 (+) Transcript_30960:146-559(+)
MLPQFNSPMVGLPQPSDSNKSLEDHISPQSPTAAEMGLARAPGAATATQQARGKSERSVTWAAMKPPLLPVAAVQYEPQANSAKTPCRSTKSRRSDSDGFTPIREVRLWVEASPMHAEPGYGPPVQPGLLRNSSCGV